MKRALDTLNTVDDNSAHSRQPDNTHESPPDDLDRALKRRKSNTPPLTQETLEKLDGTTKWRSSEGWTAGYVQSIRQWADNCASSDESAMPPSPAPSATSWRGTRRRTAKLAQRQRSPSPMKKANSPQYRAMNMADAGVFVDYFPEAPSEIEERLGHIFDGTTWTVSQREAIEELTRQYCDESRVLAKKCAGENEWRSHLFLVLLQPLNRLEPDILMLSASEKPWISELKPTAPSPYDFVPRPTLISIPQGVAQPLDATGTDLFTPQAQSTASIFPNTPVFSIPSTAPSDVSSENPNSLSTPKPDITLGLAHTSFSPIQKSVLMLLQDDCRVLSEPHQAQIGLRFPFLVTESKGGAAGGNLIVAQNQAAVDGACALNILADLERVAAQIKSQSDYCQSNQEDLMRRPGGEDKASMIVFSVTTEGPLHEIWVHFRVGDAYHMTCHRAWRTTRREDAKEFVQALARIVEWGKRGFRENILSLLGQIENAMLNGVSLRADESFSNETG